MSQFEISPAKLKREVNELKRIENILRDVFCQLDHIKKTPVFNSTAYKSIDESIETIMLEIQNEKKLLAKFNLALNDVVLQYENAEKKIEDAGSQKLASIKLPDTIFPPTETDNRDEQIDEYAKQWNIKIGDCKWTTMDIVKWQTYGGDKYLFKQKENFVQKYSDVINDAAQKYNIPPFLLAGITYNEYGGDPMWIDNVAYRVRAFDWCGPDWVDDNLTITKNPYLTSFGNVSIQLRRAAETLGYDINNMTYGEVNTLIEKLEDPVTNIYIAAAHISDLRDIDYSGIDAADLKKEDIIAIATRYNRGPDLSLEEINKNTSYGDAMYTHKDSIMSALGE